MDHSRSLGGKTVLITGGTSGIGFYTALVLARMGAAVYVTGRDASRGQAAENQLCTAAGHVNVHFIQADASTVGGNQELARRISAATDQLHILINNVGGLYNDRWATADCYEATLAMNFVGPFALTEALLSLLRQSAPARIVNVTSAGYSMCKGDAFSNIHFHESYAGFDAYNRSKYLNLLWTLALAKRLKGSRIIANALHPGTAWTTMTQNNELRLLPANIRLFWPVIRIIQRTGSPEKAARIPIFLASAPEVAHFTGQYFENSTRPKDLSADAMDTAKQEKAWQLGASLVSAACTAMPFEPVLPAMRYNIYPVKEQYDVRFTK